ncbi:MULTISPECIES: hypothetical protein [Campylobacter]|uniref:hypothetical protein n=1 Tax=Campylobacter TaxID=194 RepID=UPI000A33A7BD|nr:MULTISPECIES: hypothetical protein [unclassified Campylobacter]MCR8679673.1 hypothetical protein [Campylobacter sp. RM19072]
MHWQDTQIAVVEYDGRFFALNGWNDECFDRCWECSSNDGKRFDSIVGDKTYKIWNDENGVRLEANCFEAKEGIEYMYKVLVPYSGAANSLNGEILRAVLSIDNCEARMSGAIKFLQSHIDDEYTLKLLNHIKDGDRVKFSEFKSRIESDIYAKFLANEFVDNFEDFEDLAD